LFTHLEPTLSEMEFPSGHFWEVGDELEDSADAQAKLAAWGLAIGTVFTLVVVPTLYTLFFRVRIPRGRSAA
jgi:hypothetical protein